MELEHYLQVNAWIGSGIRVLRANPAQWEGQARLKWPLIQSICTPYESLQPHIAKLRTMVE